MSKGVGDTEGPELAVVRPMTAHSYRVDLRPLFPISFFVTAFVFLGYGATQLVRFTLGFDYLIGIVPLFYLDGEGNLAAWSAGFLLLVASALTGIVAMTERCLHPADYGRWLVLAAILLGLSANEVGGVHETVARIVQRFSDGTVGFTTASAIFLSLAAAAAATFALPLLTRLPPDTRIRCVIAGGLYVAGALFVDALHEQFPLWQTNPVANEGLLALEEGLEAAGLLVYI